MGSRPRARGSGARRGRDGTSHGRLVWVTGRYVRLTATLVQASTAQAERERQAAKEQRLRFVTLAARIGLLVRELPDDRNEKAIRTATLWDDGEVAELQVLAPSLGVGAAANAAIAAMSLRWLSERVRHVKNSPHGIGTDWRQLPSDDWSGQLKLARQSLSELEPLETPADLGLDHI
jgi:hypothetical protein